MKNLLLLLLSLPLSVFGQNAKTQPNEELRLIEKIYYNRGVYIASDEERDKLKELVFDMRADSTLKVHIIGYADRWGGEEINSRFSYVRAMYIADWMRSCRVPREQIVFVGDGVDTLAVNDNEARRVEISQIVKVVTTPEPEVITPAAEPTEDEEIDPQMQVDPVQAVEDARAAMPTEETEIDPQMQVEPEPMQTTEPKAETPAPVAAEENNSELKTQNLINHISLRTNLLYWLGGMMNVGAEYRWAESNFGVVLNAGYSFFGNTNWDNNFGGWFVAPEVRYYIPNHEQWFVGAQLLAGGFNLKFNETGRQGTVIGGGVMGGYKLTLTDRFDMDFTLGLGYGHFKYDTYYHNSETNTNHYMAQDITKNSIMPIQAGVNLIWKIK